MSTGIYFGIDVNPLLEQLTNNNPVSHFQEHSHSNKNQDNITHQRSVSFANIFRNVFTILKYGTEYKFLLTVP